MREKGTGAPSLDSVDGKAFLRREIWRRKPDEWDMENHLLSVGSRIGLNQWQIVGLV